MRNALALYYLLLQLFYLSAFIQIFKFFFLVLGESAIANAYQDPLFFCFGCSMPDEIVNSLTSFDVHASIM